MDAEAFEIPIRVGFFAFAFISMFVFEFLAPRRILSASRIPRWFNNLSLHVINILMIRGLLPVIPITVAAVAARNGWGVINYYHLPSWPAVVIN